ADDTVDAPPLVHRAPDQVRDLRSLQRVACDGDGASLAIALVDGVGACLAGGERAAREHDARAVLGHALGDRPPDAVARSRDHGHLAGEVEELHTRLSTLCVMRAANDSGTGA